MEERLQKVLAAAGVASRREAEKYILGGRVKVNGKVVKELGTKVDEKCFITVDGKPIKRERKAYYLFYKPRGVVTTMSDPQGRRTVADYVKDLPQRVFPVGRLDYNTEGLLLLTNDGALAQGLMQTEVLPAGVQPEVITLSGGVGECYRHQPADPAADNCNVIMVFHCLRSLRRCRFILKCRCRFFSRSALL